VDQVDFSMVIESVKVELKTRDNINIGKIKVNKNKVHLLTDIKDKDDFILLPAD
jgi:hypothetical protein